jgi:antitoxin component YwqK of YwqJK toxin-antitoxin module
MIQECFSISRNSDTINSSSAIKSKDLPKIEKFYNYNWKECNFSEARFYSLTIKTDSGYYRRDYFIKENALQMSGNFEDSLCKIRNGSFFYFHPNKTIESYGKCIHGKKNGLWLKFHNNNVLADSTVFSLGKIVGTSLSWFPNGYLRDSISFNADDSVSFVSWFDNGNYSCRGRYYKRKNKTGKWTYYHMNGKISSLETYDESKLINKQYFDENGILMNDTTNTDRKAQFDGGIEAWNKYISKQIYFPPGCKLVNGDLAVVVETFTVNENGNIENVFTSTPFEDKFNRIVENAIRESPEWLPEINHNRKVKTEFIVPFSFKNHK